MYFTLCCRAWILETEKKSQQCLSAALEAPSCCTGAFMYSHVDLGIHLVQPGIKDLWWFWDIVSIWKVWCGLIPFGSVWQYTDQSFLIGISKSKIRFQRTEVLLRRENGKTAEHAVLIDSSSLSLQVTAIWCGVFTSVYPAIAARRVAQLPNPPQTITKNPSSAAIHFNRQLKWEPWVFSVSLDHSWEVGIVYPLRSDTGCYHDSRQW